MYAVHRAVRRMNVRSSVTCMTIDNVHFRHPTRTVQFSIMSTTATVRDAEENIKEYCKKVLVGISIFLW